MDIWERIEAAKKLVSAARQDDGKHKEEILDGVDGHLDRIENEVTELDGAVFLVVSDKNTGFAELANVCLVCAESEEQARSKVQQEVDRSINHGPLTVKRVSEATEHRDVWSFYR